MALLPPELRQDGTNFTGIVAHPQQGVLDERFCCELVRPEA